MLRKGFVESCLGKTSLVLFGRGFVGVAREGLRGSCSGRASRAGVSGNKKAGALPRHRPVPSELGQGLAPHAYVDHEA